MVSREQLLTGGLRAYEIGRFRAALRIALIVIPLAALCLVESEGREACACLGVGLLALCIWLRWRSRRGFEIVTTGLKAGAVPLVTGLLLDQFEVQCSLDDASSLCTVFAVVVGTAAGTYIGTRDRDWRGRFGSLLTAGAVAALAAALGCVRLGVLGVASVFGGIALGILAMAAIRDRK